jgi:hypothetical protein
MTECTFYTYQCTFSTVVANLCSQHCIATQVLAESRLHFLSERNYDVLISRILYAGVDLYLIQPRNVTGTAYSFDSSTHRPRRFWPAFILGFFLS